MNVKNVESVAVAITHSEHVTRSHIAESQLPLPSAGAAFILNAGDALHIL